MIFAKEKRCSKCGLAFDCGGLFGCWCRDVKLSEAQLAMLRKRYVDCLCPTCLKAVAADISAPVTDGVVTQK
ncbi:MAG TPA: cysteine-rich CWC family protein [Vicinamibacterales bacterium]|nr:cysteine-rich CWC family protein [Vicinamibacterales bacterium]